MRPFRAVAALAVASVLVGATAIASGDTGSATAPGVTVELAGRCVVPAGIEGGWDVWDELVVVGQDSWFPPHVHDGVECVLTVEGTGRWWTPNDGTTAVPRGETFLLTDLLAHTAGNTDPEPMRYLSAHILRAGSPFRSVICASGAPSGKTDSSTSFNVVFRSQQGTGGPFTIDRRIERFQPGASYTMRDPQRLTYITVLEGALAVELDGVYRVLKATESLAVPEGARVKLANDTGDPAVTTVLEI